LRGIERPCFEPPQLDTILLIVSEPPQPTLAHFRQKKP
jgi:hypothetical protein